MTNPSPSRPHRWQQKLKAVRLDLAAEDRLSPGQRRSIRAAELIAQVAGATAAILRHGLRDLSTTLSIELGTVVVVSLGVLLAALILRDRVSLARETFRRRHLFRFLMLSFWLAGSAALFVVEPKWFGLSPGATSLEAWFAWSDAVIVLRALLGIVGVTRGATAGTWNPALVLVGTFAVLITVGTLLLMLPKCHAPGAPQLPWPDRIRVAAFTATSASCVTGLIVVPTGGEQGHWSTTGHAVILGLIQVGGLGIMTCGAFFALTTSRSLRLRESVTLRELFDPDQPVNVRRLVLSILGVTFGCELIGAVLLSGLWSDKPLGEQAWFSVFHAVSAFCNAGFDLTGTNFLGRGAAWQVWGVLAGLVILGGLGFGTLYNLTHVVTTRMRFGRRALLLDHPAAFGPKVASGRPARLTVTTRLVLITTALLLATGTAWHFFFEATPGGTAHGLPLDERLGDAWFQSAIYRTAGFNTVDLAQLRPATKLVAVVLMFIGASPVSTGGGVKTAAVAVTVLAIVSIMRGR
ncbi:MAG: potassium transporter TrkG, partial [Planctomycetaceae bacterium]